MKSKVMIVEKNDNNVMKMKEKAAEMNLNQIFPQRNQRDIH